MKSIKSITILQILNILGFTGTILINALANILPINGKNTGELSDLYPNLFVPAGITFSIWGIIYLALLIFTIFQAKNIFKKVNENSYFIEKIGYYFFLSCLANISWIFAWHYQQITLSLAVMLILLISLIIIYQNLGIGIKSGSKKENFFAHLPFSIYLGWISIATIANISVFLVNIKWNRLGLSEVFWTITIIIAGAVLTLFMLYKRNDVIYGLVVIWAFIGIIIKRLTSALFVSTGLITVLLLCVFIILTGIVFRFKNWLKY